VLAAVTTSAVCFDFNGTLSLDEELMYEVLAELFAERGRPLPRATYFEQFVGLGDDEIAMRSASPTLSRSRTPRWASPARKLRGCAAAPSRRGFRASA